MKDDIDNLICAACESTDLNINGTTRSERVLEVAERASVLRHQLASLLRVAEALVESAEAGGRTFNEEKLYEAYRLALKVRATLSAPGERKEKTR